MLSQVRLRDAMAQLPVRVAQVEVAASSVKEAGVKEVAEERADLVQEPVTTTAAAMVEAREASRLSPVQSVPAPPLCATARATTAPTAPAMQVVTAALCLQLLNSKAT